MKQRDIVKANIKIECLQQQHDELITMHTEVLRERNNALREISRLERERKSTKEHHEIFDAYYNLLSERDQLKKLLNERKKEKRESRIISRTELTVALETYYEVSEVKIGEVRVRAPTSIISTNPLSASSSDLINIEIEYIGNGTGAQ